MAYTMEVATKIAGYGADKMDSQGYKIEAMALAPGSFYVRKPKTEEQEAALYFTTVLPLFKTCTCPFFKENGVCKHIVAVERRAEEDARIAEQEAEFEERQIWADYLSLRDEAEAEPALAWPVCAYHGPHEAAENGYALSWCEGCESAL